MGSLSRLLVDNSLTAAELLTDAKCYGESEFSAKFLNLKNKFLFNIKLNRKKNERNSQILLKSSGYLLS